jgi:predicted enzyme related to lactoylglutathione lyase
VCHARGINAKVPPQWLIYIQVKSVPAAIEAALRAGGRVVDGPRTMGPSAFAVLQDPAGAVFAVIE